MQHALVLGAFVLSACGAATPEPVDEERIAQRAAEIVLEELRADGVIAPEGGQGGAVAAVQSAAELLEQIRRNEAAGEPEPTPSPPPAEVLYQVPLGSSPSAGPADALVTIVWFTDFECPFCGRVRPTIQQVRDQYGNDIRIVYKMNPLPFHVHAGPAAHAALEAHRQRGDAGFQAMHDLLFDNQRALSRSNLESYARRVRLNMGRFKRALTRSAHQAAIDADQALARQIGATGTPTFFINGRMIRGAQPLSAFTELIDRELAAARALVDAGTPRNRVYETVTRAGVTTAPPPAPRPVTPSAGPPAPPQVYTIAVPTDAPVRGPASARVTIQLFTDFQCPFCGRIRPTLDQITSHYGARVRIVFRNYPLPFHNNAPLAHQAAWEVHRQGGAAAFWAYHDLLFDNQRALERADLERYASQISGVDVAELRRALDTQRHQARVQEDIDAVRVAGARIGTPSLFIDGELVQGAQPFEAFRAVIDRSLATPRPRP